MTCKTSLRPRAADGRIICISALDGMQNALFVVLSHPQGITAHEVASLIGLRVSATLSKLRMLRKFGYIGPSRYSGGQGTLWLPIEESVVACEAYALIAKKRRSEQKKQRREVVSDETQAAFEAGEHRVIPAHLATPMRKLGPRWVFDMQF